MIQNNIDLDKIVGGTTITGTIINAFTDIIRVLGDAGRSLGASLRRISEKDLCPLD